MKCQVISANQHQHGIHKSRRSRWQRIIDSGTAPGSVLERLEPRLLHDATTLQPVTGLSAGEFHEEIQGSWQIVDHVPSTGSEPKINDGEFVFGSSLFGYSSSYFVERPSALNPNYKTTQNGQFNYAISSVSPSGEADMSVVYGEELLIDYSLGYPDGYFWMTPNQDQLVVSLASTIDDHPDQSQDYGTDDPLQPSATLFTTNVKGVIGKKQLLKIFDYIESPYGLWAVLERDVSSDDTDAFQWIAPETGAYRLELEAAHANGIHLHSLTTSLPPDYYHSEDYLAGIAIPVVKGDKYNFTVSGSKSGAYTLTISEEDSIDESMLGAWQYDTDINYTAAEKAIIEFKANGTAILDEVFEYHSVTSIFSWASTGGRIVMDRIKKTTKFEADPLEYVDYSKTQPQRWYHDNDGESMRFYYDPPELEWSGMVYSLNRSVTSVDPEVKQLQVDLEINQLQVGLSGYDANTQFTHDKQPGEIFKLQYTVQNNGSTSSEPAHVLFVVADSPFTGGLASVVGLGGLRDDEYVQLLNPVTGSPYNTLRIPALSPWGSSESVFTEEIEVMVPHDIADRITPVFSQVGVIVDPHDDIFEATGTQPDLRDNNSNNVAVKSIDISIYAFPDVDVWGTRGGTTEFGNDAVFIRDSDLDTVVSVADGTNFGVVEVGKSSQDHKFRINNRGWAPALFEATSNDRVKITGEHADEFEIVVVPASSLAGLSGVAEFAGAGPMDKTFFTIRFTPKGNGRRHAMVEIPTNDEFTTPAWAGLQPSDAEYTYRFAIGGSGIGAPEVGEDSAAIIGTNGSKMLSYVDADGTVVTITVKNGQGSFELSGDNVQLNQTSKGIVVTGTNVSVFHFTVTDAVAATISVTTKGGDGRTSFGGMAINGSANAITMPGVDFSGDVLVTGLAKSVVLGSISGDRTVSFGGSPNDKPAKLTLGQLSDVSLTSGAPVQLTAISWTDTDPQTNPDALTAPFATKLIAKGDAKKNIAGHWAADVTLTGEGVVKEALKSFKVQSLSDAIFDIPGAIGIFDVSKGTAEDFTLNVDGNAKTIKLGSVSDSTIAAENVGTLQAASWLDGQISVDTLKTIKIAGDMRADLEVEGDLAAKLVLGSAKVAGLLSGEWDIDGPVGAITAGNVSQFTGNVTGAVKGFSSKGAFSGLLAAFSFAKIDIKTNLTNAKLIAGGNPAGSFITALKIGGNMTNSSILVGVDPVNNIFGDSDDTLLGGTSHLIKTLSIGGATDTNNPMFFAGLFPKSASINKLKVVPETDARFVITPV